LNLLVVSHPCVTPINQDFYAHVAALSGWSVSIVLPERWRTEYGMRLRAARWHQFQGRLIPLPVFFSGHVPLHVYRARLRAIVARERPHAIYVHHEPYAAATFQTFLAARRRPDLPLGFYSAQNLMKRHPWPFSAAERYVYAHASFAFPVSRSVASVLQVRGFRGHTEVLPLGVDTDCFRPNGGMHAESRQAVPLTLGYVGRLAPEKGISTFLQALQRLPAQSVRARVVGAGPSTAALKQQASSLGLDGRIHWNGYVAHDQMPAVYRALDVVVVPSRSVPNWREQFGRVVIESLACGVPVVTSDCGELPNLVAATDGGWTFPEGSAAGLAAVLREFLKRPGVLKDRGNRGRQAVENQFAVEKLAARFIDVVEAAIQRHPRG
jgi:glycosyltransferase involved in cell wall biosynthesis